MFVLSEVSEDSSESGEDLDGSSRKTSISIISNGKLCDVTVHGDPDTGKSPNQGARKKKTSIFSKRKDSHLEGKRSTERRPSVIGGVLSITRQISQLSLPFVATDKDIETFAMTNAKNVEAIAKAIQERDIEALKDILHQDNINLETKDEDGNTPLMLASSAGHLDMAKLLLHYGGDCRAENDDKCTSLHIAAANGHSEVCAELIDADAPIEVKDTGQWTPLVWACYRGRSNAVETLLNKGADPNARGLYHVTCLVWAAGRGYDDIVKTLLEHHAKVDLGDKYGTTALIWAARNGKTEIVDMLLKAGASVDTVGMYSWNPLLVATKGNYLDIVNLILDKNPNVNTVDKDGFTALGLACKEGFEEIALKLLSFGAYTSLQDKAGDTNLIHACKGGHKGIVEALLKKFADVNIKGKDNKTCLHWAIDKNHPRIVKLLLSANPDLEARTADGDTALLRAVRGRHSDIVQMLLDRKAKISATDRKGDTALHIAMRSRSKAVVEILLRNPKHSQLLYRPNRQGETPYNIDMNSQKTILGHVFGARRLNTNEDSENILGYDLYSSALADILTEPALSMPITVGLYAKWGSGKSFLLNKLKQEMESFSREWGPTFHLSPLLFFVVVQFATLLGVVAFVIAFMSDLSFGSAIVGLVVSVSIFVLSYLFVIAVWKGSAKYDLMALYNLSVFLAKRFNRLKLVLRVMFCHPPGHEYQGVLNQAQPLRLLFTDQTKVITSSGGQNSVTQMIGSLLDAIEDQYGTLSTRLFRAFKPQSVSSTSPSKWRRLCCIPYILIYLLVFFGIMVSIVLTCILIDLQNDLPGSVNSGNPTTASYGGNVERSAEIEEDLVLAFLITMAVMVGVILIANLYTIANCVQCLMFSQRRQLQRAISKLDVVKSEGYLQAIKGEAHTMLEMVKCLDAFTGQQSRMVVVVDGLDSCEQSKVLSVLEAVHLVFSDPGAPFIIILAIDPHVITKAIELNLNKAFSETSIGGSAYIRNIVHLPFYLQNSGLRRVKVAQKLSEISKARYFASSSWIEADDGSSGMQRKLSTESNIYIGGAKKKYQKRPRSKQSDSISSSVGSNLNKSNHYQGPQDLKKILLNDDYFSDINPRSLRRLMNVIYVMGKLMKAFRIDFNWTHLAFWVNLTEQWPYRLSWMILYAEIENDLEDNSSLKSIYDAVKGIIPTQKDIEPLIELDRDEKKLEAFLNLHKKNMSLVDLKIFLPFTINLDPYIKKVLKEEVQNLEEMGLTLKEVLKSNTTISPNPNKMNVNPLLTRRQAAGLSKSLSSRADLSINDPMLARLNNFTNQAQPPMWPYVNSMMPPYNNRTQPTLSMTSSAENLPLIDLPGEITQVPLSQKSVEEICLILKSVQGLSPTMLDTYCQSVTSQNLSGTVLAHCQIDELKGVLNMNFGDWEIFRLILQSLRHHEKSSQSRNVKFSISNKANEEKTPPAKTKDRVDTTHVFNKPSNSSSSNQAKQVFMEDALISGLLSTLNEEAHEDIVTEELLQAEDAAAASEGSSNDVYLTNGNSESDVVFLSYTSPVPFGTKGTNKSDINVVETGSMSWYGSSRVIANSTGGSSWTESQPDIKALNSVPTSPTATIQVHSSPRTSITSVPQKKPNAERSKKYIRDRLDSFSGTTNNRPSMPSEYDDEDPYAWISRTAPASPHFGTSRHSVEGAVDHKRGHAPWQLDERLHRVKERFRHAFHSFGSEKSGLEEECGETPGGAGVLASNSNHVTTTFITKTKEQPKSKESSIDEEDVSPPCSSPEQETVTKRPTPPRGPHVQELFSYRTQTPDIVTAVLPDGQVMTAALGQEATSAKPEAETSDSKC